MISAFGIEHGEIAKSRKSRDVAQLGGSTAGVGGVLAAVGHESKSTKPIAGRRLVRGGLATAALGSTAALAGGSKSVVDEHRKK